MSSEIATLRQNIEHEYVAAQIGLCGLASDTTRHRIITARQERIGLLHDHLRDIVGEAAIMIVSDTLDHLPTPPTRPQVQQVLLREFGEDEDTQTLLALIEDLWRQLDRLSARGRGSCPRTGERATHTDAGGATVMTTDTLLLPQNLFWTLEGGLGLALLLVLWAAQAVRRWHGSPIWRLLLAMGQVIALGLVVAAWQLGTVTTHSFGASMLLHVALLGLVLAGGLHLVVSCLWPRQSQPPLVRPPTPPLTQQSRREARRWKH